MRKNQGSVIFIIAVTTVISLSVLMGRASAQGTELTLHSFTGGPNDGSNPIARPIFDQSGNLYGTTIAGGAAYSSGAVYQLTPSNGGWKETLIHSFGSSGDGNGPIEAGLIIDKAGNLYGTTFSGGGTGCGGSGCGTVYELSPSNGGWTETIIYDFSGIDGLGPYLGHLTWDKAGNLYGTTKAGGKYNAGTVFQLRHTKSGWKGKVLYHFAGGKDANWANESLAFDQAGNLYGASFEGGGTGCGGLGCGTVFELSPTTKGWKEKVLHRFSGGKDGAQPYESVIVDKTGSLYGTTFGGGDAKGHGVIYKLFQSNGTWKEKVLYTFTGGNDGANPYSNVTLKNGVLYGTTDQAGAKGYGILYKLTPTKQGWKQSVLYTFTGGTDGGVPLASITFDKAGNIYGTAIEAGNSSCQCGTVYEFKP